MLAKRQVETLEADVEPLKALIAANSYAIAVLVGEYPEALARLPATAWRDPTAAGPRTRSDFRSTSCAGAPTSAKPSGF